MIGALDFRSYVKSAAWDDGSIWLILSAAPTAIVQVDAATMAPIAAYANPHPTVIWQGIAVSYARVYLLGTRPSSNEGVFMKLGRPGRIPIDLPDFEIPLDLF